MPSSGQARDLIHSLRAAAQVEALPHSTALRLAQGQLEVRSNSWHVITALGQAIPHRHARVPWSRMRSGGDIAPVDGGAGPWHFYIRAFDEGAARPPLPDWLKVEIRQGRRRIQLDDDSELIYEPGARILTVVVEPGREVLIFVVGGLPWYELAAPLRAFVPRILDPNGKWLIHAAAVGTEDGAVLLLGPADSGKTTTALHCLQAGMSFLGDDVVTVAATGEGFTVQALYATAKVRWGEPILNGPLGGAVANPGSARDPSSKAVLHLHPQYESQLPDALPLRSILMLRRSGGPPAAATVSSAAAAAVLTSTTRPVRHRLSEGFVRAVTRLTRTVPVIEIELGESPQTVTPTILQHLVEPAGVHG